MPRIAPRLLPAGLLLVLACTPVATPTHPSDGPTATSPPSTAAPASPSATATPAAPPSPTQASAPSATSSPSGTTPPATSAPGSPTAVAWQELTPSGAPAAREDHTWTVSSDGTSAYVFGGRAGRREFADLWRYDLASDTWDELQPSGGAPAARFGHTAVWAEGTGLIVWSGQAGTSFFADIWAYDAATNAWSELPAAGDVPPARYGSCAAIGPDGRMWISHGFTEDSGRFSDTRAYDFAVGAWSDLSPDGGRPVERCLHDCLWTPDGHLLIYAGQTTGAPAIGDLWSYDFASSGWTRATRPEPEPRQLYALAQSRGTAFVFGGGASDGRALGDLWQLNLTELAWSVADVQGSAPAARFGATLIADDGRNRLLLFGGKSDNTELGDLWALSLTP